MKKWILVIGCVLISMTLLSACTDQPNRGSSDQHHPNTDTLPVISAEQTNDVPGTTEGLSTTTAAETETEPAETHGFFKSDVDKFEIETPFAILQYPKKWEDQVTVTQTDGDFYTVSFFAIIDEKDIPLFDIVFGDNPNASFELGSMKTADGETVVSVVDYSGEAIQSVPENKVDIISQMTEDMNEVISGLVYNYGLEIR